MADELVKRYKETGMCIVPVGEFKQVKLKLDAASEDYHCHWDNSFQVYIFEEKRGNLLD